MRSPSVEDGRDDDDDDDGGGSDTHTIAIALELLDNLPHDKVRRCSRTGETLQAEVRIAADADDDSGSGGRSGAPTSSSSEARIFGRGRGRERESDPTPPPPLEEVFVPLTDPLLISALRDAPAYAPTIGGDARWVPTAAIGLLRRLLSKDGTSSLSLSSSLPPRRRRGGGGAIDVLLIDFDWLPPPDPILEVKGGERGKRRKSSSRWAEGEPLVTDMNDTDRSCYLSSHPDLCDILFPTDFERLAKAARIMGGGGDNGARVEAERMKQSEFLIRYGSEEVDRTRGGRWRKWLWGGWGGGGGYTPLLDDFTNCSALTISSSRSSSS